MSAEYTIEQAANNVAPSQSFPFSADEMRTLAQHAAPGVKKAVHQHHNPEPPRTGRGGR